VPSGDIEQQIRARMQQRLYSSAFDIIVRHFSDKVMRLCYSILGNRALAEEITQDVLVRIWRALPSFRGEASIATWIYTIARNTSLTAAKRVRAATSVSLEEPLVRTQVEQRAFSPTVTSDLPKLLSALPENHRRVMMLFYMEEKSYEEVARLLDLPIGTVRTYLHRGRKTLAALMVQQKKGRSS
jgi:RNA polymerase sigma-70 factor, ECF subfamily